jgi:hypothetical protein
MQYLTNHIEDMVEFIYRSVGITSPEQLEVYNVADKLKNYINNLQIFFVPLKTSFVRLDNHDTIIISDNLPLEEKWVKLGLMLSYVFMPTTNLFVTKDYALKHARIKAETFALNFCVPSFMLTHLELPKKSSDAINMVAKTFSVPYLFAAKRIEEYLNQWNESIKSAFSVTTRRVSYV